MPRATERNPDGWRLFNWRRLVPRIFDEWRNLGFRGTQAVVIEAFPEHLGRGGTIARVDDSHFSNRFGPNSSIGNVNNRRFSFLMAPEDVGPCDRKLSSSSTHNIVTKSDHTSHFGRLDAAALNSASV